MMEKLIKLLNEYEKSGLNEFEIEGYEEWRYCKWNGKIFSGNWENNNELKPCEIISKRYGFIERLVENDKIDFTKLEDNGVWYDINTESDYLDVLALLAIHDNTIEYLVSILK